MHQADSPKQLWPNLRLDPQKPHYECGMSESAARKLGSTGSGSPGTIPALWSKWPVLVLEAPWVGTLVRREAAGWSGVVSILGWHAGELGSLGSR